MSEHDNLVLDIRREFNPRTIALVILYSLSDYDFEDVSELADILTDFLPDTNSINTKVSEVYEESGDTSTDEQFVANWYWTNYKISNLQFLDLVKTVETYIRDLRQPSSN